MRRCFHGLLVGVLTLWIPIDSAVAGWWHHHHRHAMPVAWGPAFPPPCGGGGPFPGWAGAIVIDDRPLGAPSPFAVFAAPPAEVVLDSWITTGPVEGSIVDVGTVVHEGTVIHEGSIIDEGTVVDEGSIDAGDCVCDPCQGESSADTGMAFEGTVVDETVIEGTLIDGGSVIDEPTPAPDVVDYDEGPVRTERPIAIPVPPTRDVNTRVETTPEAESPTSLELPGTAATTSGDPAAAAQPGPADAPASSVLEPWEPKTVQGDTAAETATDESPAETMEDAEAFERAETPADVNATDEPVADGADVDSTPQPKRRNLFDEAPTDESEAFETPRATEDSPPPSDAFEAPAASDDDFGIPEEPMDAGDEMPADDFGDDSGAPASDDSGFEPATEEPMDDAPVDESMEEGDPGFEGEPGFEGDPLEQGEPLEEGDPEFEGEPGIEGEPEPLKEEAPAASDPFDANTLHTPGQPLREWRDDTGRHGTEGRLVEVRADRVRILKTSGRHTTVPMARLSRADRDHVAGVALALGRPAARPGETAGL